MPRDGETVDIDIKEHLINAVLNNCRIIDQNNNWPQSSFLEAYYIKTLKPEIDDGLKASKELDLFKIVLVLIVLIPTLYIFSD